MGLFRIAGQQKEKVIVSAEELSPFQEK